MSRVAKVFKITKRGYEIDRVFQCKNRESLRKMLAGLDYDAVVFGRHTYTPSQIYGGEPGTLNENFKPRLASISRNPFKLVKYGKGYAVMNSESGKIHSKKPLSWDKARKQMFAIEVSEGMIPRIKPIKKHLSSGHSWYKKVNSPRSRYGFYFACKGCRKQADTSYVFCPKCGYGKDGFEKERDFENRQSEISNEERGMSAAAQWAIEEKGLKPFKEVPPGWEAVEYHHYGKKMDLVPFCHKVEVKPKSRGLSSSNYEQSKISEAIKKAKKYQKPIFVFPTAYGLKLDFKKPPFWVSHYAVLPSGEVIDIPYRPWESEGKSLSSIRAADQRYRNYLGAGKKGLSSTQNMMMVYGWNPGEEAKVPVELVNTMFALRGGRKVSAALKAKEELDRAAGFKVFGTEDVFKKSSGLSAIYENLPAKWYLDDLRAARNYKPLRAEIVAWKYGGRRKNEDDLVRQLEDFLRSSNYPPKVDFIIPVPISPRKLKERGFSPALILARYAALNLGKPVVNRLSRIRDTKPQSRTKGEHKVGNVAGAFYCPPFKEFIGKKILLVDDITSTGATMNEVARVLKQAGAAKVYGLALAGSKFFHHKGKV